MPGILSNAFGGDDSSNQQDSNIVSDLGATVGLDASNSNSSERIDEDGASETAQSDQNFGLDLDTDSLLGGSNESASETDGSDGLLG